MALAISVEDPSSADVVALLEQHLAFSREVTPEGGVFALDLASLRQPSVTFFCARIEGALVGVAALRELDADHGELKSMHTTRTARRQGVARALVEHVLQVAASRSYRQVSLETGNFDAFAPARALYRSLGFRPCTPFGDYVGSSTSACMTIDVI